jgi:hypothetical protein
MASGLQTTPEKLGKLQLNIHGGAPIHVMFVCCFIIPMI